MRIALFELHAFDAENIAHRPGRGEPVGVLPSGLRSTELGWLDGDLERLLVQLVRAVG